MRPNSIVQFERLFLIAWAINVLVTVLSWNASVALMTRDTGMDGSNQGIFMLATALGSALMLALWYFTAHRASVVAKWILSIWFVVTAMVLALAAFWTGIRFGAVEVLSWVRFVIFAWSISYLFKPDAEAWFAKR